MCSARTENAELELVCGEIKHGIVIEEDCIVIEEHFRQLGEVKFPHPAAIIRALRRDGDSVVRSIVLRIQRAQSD